MVKSARSHRFRPLRTPAGVAATLMIFGIVATFADLVHDIHWLGLFNEAVDYGSDSAVRAVEAAEGTSLTLYYANAAILFVTAAFFLVWVYRAHANVHALGFNELKFSPGWAVGWWFIPFFNLVQPARAMAPSCIGSPRRAILPPGAPTSASGRSLPGGCCSWFRAARPAAASSVSPPIRSNRYGSCSFFKYSGTFCICPPASWRSGWWAGSPPESKAQRRRRTGRIRRIGRIGRIGAGLSEILDFLAHERRPRLQIPGRPYARV